MEAQRRVDRIPPKLNPLTPGNKHGNLTLTKRRKRRNAIARARDDEILFDPAITSKEDLSECFRIFTDPARISNKPAERTAPRETLLNIREIEIYTDGACFNNGKANARSGSGVWFGPNHKKNRAIRNQGPAQSNQIGELIAIIAAVESVPIYQPLRIITDSRYATDGLTMHLGTWEDQGWIAIRNAPLFKKAAHLLRKRTAKTTFKWVKGHEGNEGNEGSDRLAKEGAMKETPDIVDLEIPIEFDLQGAKLATLTQKRAYKGIQERTKQQERQRTSLNIQRTSEKLKEYNKETETEETIWRGVQNPSISNKIQQFLYKAMHSTQKIGQFWKNIPDYEHRSLCHSCQTTETMDHILTECSARPNRLIWDLAKDTWPHPNIPWPTISLGTILGCGSLKPPQGDPQQRNAEPDGRRTPARGATRLLHILISESAYLIWVLRCERTINDKTHSETEIRKRWLKVINRRLTEDKIIATQIKRNSKQKNKVKHTWEAVLTKTNTLPDQWMLNREVLVGTRQRA